MRFLLNIWKLTVCHQFGKLIPKCSAASNACFKLPSFYQRISTSCQKGKGKDQRGQEVHSTSCDISGITLDRYDEYCLLRNINGFISLPLNYLWLRDHCKCEKCYRKDTLQRTMDGLELDLNSKPASLSVNAADQELHIIWHDGHASRFSIDWLLESTYEGRRQVPHYVSEYRELWDAKRAGSMTFPSVKYKELESDDSDSSTLTDLLQSLMKYGLAFVTECDVSVEGTRSVCERVVPFIEPTMFGAMWTFTSDGARSDTAYTSIYLAPHTDTTYISQPAGVQVFQCLSHDGSGGETLLVDGFECSDRLLAAGGEGRAAYNMLSMYDICGEYRERRAGGRGEYYTTGHGPLLLHDTDTDTGGTRNTNNIIRIRYNPYDRACLSSIPHTEMRSFYKAYRALSEIINSDDVRYEVKLEPGTVLLIDNWRLLHGRNAFTGRRQMCGCYLPRDYIVSQWRTINKYRIPM